MNLRFILPVAIIFALIGAGIGIAGYIWIVGGDATPSTELAAPTLDINSQPTVNPEVLMTQLAEAQGEIESLEATIAAQPAQENQVEENQAEAPNSTPEEDEQTSEENQTGAMDSTQAERVLYRIEQENSSVSFAVYEEMRGTPQDAVGTTNQIAGDIIVDYGNPQASQLGTMRINARSIATDSGFRDRALRAEILMSSRDEFEFIEFVPTDLINLPENISTGESYTLEITGDLIVRGATNPVTFTAEVTVDSDETISGTATTTITYTEWGIDIPSTRMISNVSDQATLTIEFVANRVTE